MPHCVVFLNIRLAAPLTQAIVDRLKLRVALDDALRVTVA